MLKLDAKLAIWVAANTKPAPRKHESIRITTTDLFVFKKIRVFGQPGTWHREGVASIIIPTGEYIHLPNQSIVTGRSFDGKFRASKAKVHSIVSFDKYWRHGREIVVKRKEELVGYSTHSRGFTYRVGDIVKPDTAFTFKDEQCAPGIHFFLHSDQAVNY